MISIVWLILPLFNGHWPNIGKPSEEKNYGAMDNFPCIFDKSKKTSGERCVVPTPVPAEHKLTAVWKLSDAPSKLKHSVDINPW